MRPLQQTISLGADSGCNSIRTKSFIWSLVAELCMLVLKRRAASVFAHAKKVSEALCRKIDSSASIRHLVVMVGKLGFLRKDFPNGMNLAAFFSSELPYPLNECANMSMLRLAKTAATAHSLHETGLVFAATCTETQSFKPIMTGWLWSDQDLD